jgi:hypothetical protein
MRPILSTIPHAPPLTTPTLSRCVFQYRPVFWIEPTAIGVRMMDQAEAPSVGPHRSANGV